MRPEWLPEELCLNNSSLQEDYDFLHDIFIRDFSNIEDIVVDSKGVYIDRGRDVQYPEYERGFLHFVTRVNGSERPIDYERAKKLNWVLPVLKHYMEPEVKAFWSLGPKDKSLYLWLEDFDFLIVLKDWKSNKNRKTRIVVTSYSVDDSYRRVLRKRYKNAYRIL